MLGFRYALQHRQGVLQRREPLLAKKSMVSAQDPRALKEVGDGISGALLVARKCPNAVRISTAIEAI